ncbi:MAG: Flp pilus assembly complex ATPase component TadA, partial [Elusimicrobiota bacterium]|nr:Flp pilus assembly complex ATPase component TadA [Elusimicrobiota bacterium]
MSKNKIIAISGPKEGVGKTTFAINFAMQYALNTKQKIVILDGDIRCRNDISYYLNSIIFETITNLWTAVEKVKLSGLDTSLFKGRIPFNDQGIGVLNIAKSFEMFKTLQPAYLLKVLSIFGELYNFVIDIESMPEDFVIPLYDLSDKVFWIMDPLPINLKNTVEYFAYLGSKNFSMNKFNIILNRIGMPESLITKQINSKLSTFGKSVVLEIPEEKNVTQAVSRRQIIIIERPHTSFARNIRDLIDWMFINKIENIENKEEKKSNLWKGLLDSVSEEENLNEVEIRPQTKDELRKSIKLRVHKQLIIELNNKKIDINNSEENLEKQQKIKEMVEETAAKILSGYGDLGFTRQESQEIVGEILDDALGLGPLEKILRDETITEIMVNKKDQIYIEKSGKLLLSDQRFNSDEQVVQVIRRIIAPLGRRIDESVPLVDARLQDGSRVNAIIPPLAVQGPMITIRRFPEKIFNSDDLINFGSMNKDMVEFLKTCVYCEKNIIVSGGTGSGKTTLLNMLSSFIPNDERILTVEDVAELRLQQEHVGRLESRPPNIEGKGEITIRELVKNTLRMRPDRIVVGECRGGEALDMLQAMNTGHDGSLTTIHANSPFDMIGRLEAMVLMSGAELPIKVIRGYIASAVNFVIQINRLQDGTRKVTAITEILDMDENDGTIKMQDIFLFKRKGVDETGKVVGDFVAT